MAFEGIAWPGIGHSRKALASARRKDATLLKQVLATPGLFKNPTRLSRTLAAKVADYDAGLAALNVARDAHAATRPKRSRRVSRPESADPA